MGSPWLNGWCEPYCLFVPVKGTGSFPLSGRSNSQSPHWTMKGALHYFIYLSFVHIWDLFLALYHIPFLLSVQAYLYSSMWKVSCFMWKKKVNGFPSNFWIVHNKYVITYQNSNGIRLPQRYLCSTLEKTQGRKWLIISGEFRECFYKEDSIYLGFQGWVVCRWEGYFVHRE